MNEIKKSIDKELDVGVFYNYWIKSMKQAFYSIGLLSAVVTMAFVLSGCSLINYYPITNNIPEPPAIDLSSANVIKELPDKPIDVPTPICCIPDADYPNSCDGFLPCEED